jgi:hypothetical protein
VGEQGREMGGLRIGTFTIFAFFHSEEPAHPAAADTHTPLVPSRPHLGRPASASWWSRSRSRARWPRCRTFPRALCCRRRGCTWPRQGPNRAAAAGAGVALRCPTHSRPQALALAAPSTRPLAAAPPRARQHPDPHAGHPAKVRPGARCAGRALTRRRQYGLRIADTLRELNVGPVEASFLDRRPLGQCLAEANRRHMQFVVVIGRQNLDEDSVSLKKMFGNDHEGACAMCVCVFFGTNLCCSYHEEPPLQRCDGHDRALGWRARPCHFACAVECRSAL